MSNNPYTTYGRTSNHAYTPQTTINTTNNSGHGYSSGPGPTGNSPIWTKGPSGPLSGGHVLTSNGIWAKNYNSTWLSGLNLSDDPFYHKEPEPDTLLENKHEAQELSEVLKPRRSTR